MPYACLRISCITPARLLTLVLLTAVILVNGWTDAPNAITTVVASRALGFRPAALLAAVCNLAGALASVLFFPHIIRTFQVMTGGTGTTSAAVLPAVLCTVVLWAVLGWYFGIPTSESHALIAGMTGAALACSGRSAGQHLAAWCPLLSGFLLSLALGYLSGFGWAGLTRGLMAGKGLRHAQIGGAALMAFAHGAQDGQKFAAFLLSAAAAANPSHSLPAVLLCGCLMGLGTLAGGRRIVNQVGQNLTRLTAQSGFAADLGGGTALLLCALLGCPVSTTHAKTAAVLGAGQASGGPVEVRLAVSMAAVWLITFPACGAIAFLLCRITEFFLL